MVKIVMMNWNYNAFSVIIVKFVRIIIVKYQLLIAIHLRIELGVELGVDWFIKIGSVSAWKKN